VLGAWSWQPSSSVRCPDGYWLWFGVVAGLGLEEKYSIAVFGLGIVVGLLLTEQRRVFLDKWIWLGGLAAFLIFFPNVLWNIKYDWPFVQLMGAIRAEGRDVVLGPFPFFFQQTLLVNPLTAPIWLAGLFALLFSARLNRWPCAHKGNERAITIPIGSKQGHYVTLCAA
jgi:4-amino-4-deoxy-L-arabinose transferase-like glycosyltransferase